MQINKKIICILLLFFAFAVYAEDSITYEVLVKSDIYSDSTGRVYKKTKKGEKITTTFPTPIGFDDYINEDNQTKFLFFKENKEYYGIQIKNIKIANSDSLPSELVNFDSTGLTRMVIPSYYLKVLSNQNAKEILNYEKTYARYIAKNNETDVLGNRIQNSPDEFSATISSIYINLNSWDEIYFKKFTKISDSVYECEGISHIGYTYENHDHSENFWQVWVDNTQEGQTEIFTLTVDGDFLHIDNKTRNKHIITLAYVDNSVIQELINLFRDEKCDLTKVTWPRHADGTCDYDGWNWNEINGKTYEGFRSHGRRFYWLASRK